MLSLFFITITFHLLLIVIKDDEEGDEDDDDEGSEMELDEDFPEINAAPHIRFERFDRDDDLIIEFDNMFSNNGKQGFWRFILSLRSFNYEYILSEAFSNPCLLFILHPQY